MSLSQIEQLQADLATIQKAAEIAKKQGFHERTGNYDQVKLEIKGKIAELETQQEPPDEWADVKQHIDKVNDKDIFKRYIRHIEAKVAKLEEEIGANESEAYLGDFRVLKTAQDIAKYAGSNDIPSCQKAFCRNLINSINDFTLYVRLWEGLHSLAPYKWSSVGLHDKHLINKKEGDK